MNSDFTSLTCFSISHEFQPSPSRVIQDTALPPQCTRVTGHSQGEHSLEPSVSQEEGADDAAAIIQVDEKLGFSLIFSI